MFLVPSAYFFREKNIFQDLNIRLSNGLDPGQDQAKLRNKSVSGYGPENFS